MKSLWQLQEAKNKFSEVVNHARTDGPQEISRHGEKTAVVISFEEYKKLKKHRGSLAEFFHSSPLKEIDLTRTKDRPREVEL
ncbi:MAG: type II toxin-antitoxin system Phd/YefM family antitoxin [Chitinivibrionales bacterium]|nr:type II toxin-antitoxin system Phd/YefM family antitoxin [Chitinivibrionales bacterium]